MTEEIQNNIIKCIAIVLAMDDQYNQKYYIKQCINRYSKKYNTYTPYGHDFSRDNGGHIF